MNNRTTNLNHAKIWSDGDPIALDDFAATSESARVTCHFRNVHDALVGYINRYDYMVGCVAWLTDPVILRALATRCGVSIIVQKEDFLRPDCDERLDTRRLYESIRSGFDRYQISGILSSMSFASDPELDAVRCVGNHNSTKSPAHPRAHHKFLVFGRMSTPEEDGRSATEEDGYECGGTFVPEAVWTGSFNFSVTAGRSLENAVFIEDTAIAQAYANEFSQVAALSEPLNWQDPWSSPEWRCGT
jgi:phosphatidylserine/phosphatidylglycerophosphate/cardiolipin synthase-like enzyme